MPYRDRRGNQYRRTFIAASAALALVVVAGCGTRANFNGLEAAGSQAGAANGSAGAGQVATGGTGAGAAGQVVSSGPSSSGQSAGGAPAGVSGAQAVAGAAVSAGAPQSGSGAPSRGVSTGSAKSRSGATPGPPITVGFVLQDASGASAVVGSNVPITSAQRQQQIAGWLVDWVNSHGGVAGRKIVPTYETVSVTTNDTQRVADCEYMAQDQHDQAVMDVNIMLQDDEWACFAANHVDFFGNVSGTDRPFMDAHAPYITTTWMGLDRQMYAMAHGAAAAGWLDSSKLGIILPDTPEGHADFTQVLVPQLAAVGVKNYDARFISMNSDGSQTQQTNNAELAFATEGVKKIFFFQDILVYLQFINQAKAENYYPEYAFPDFEGAAGIAAFYGGNSVNQGSIAVSSSPLYVLDNNSSNSQSAGQTVLNRNSLAPAMQNCLDILSKESGVNFYDPNQSQDPDLDSFYLCDELFLFWKAASAVGPGFTPANLGPGLRALGTTYQSTQQNSTSYGSGHHDGASSYRVGRFDSTCTCFVKSTAWIPIPT